MGFFSKLVKGVGNVVKGVAKAATTVVSKATGFASKVLPSPIGDVAKTASEITGFGAKLLGSGDSPPKTLAATANNSLSANVQTAKQASTALKNAQAKVFNTTTDGKKSITVGGIEIDKKKSWFQKNLVWIIPSAIAVVFGAIIAIFSKRKR